MDAQQAGGPGMIPPDIMVSLKALLASAAGRALLLLQARRDVRVTWQKALAVLLYEPPLILAFAFLGWQATGAFGLDSEEWRLTVVSLVSWSGMKGVDLIMERLFPVRPSSGGGQ